MRPPPIPQPLRPPEGIAALQPGRPLAGRFAVVRKDRQQAKNGTPYLSLELRDRTRLDPGPDLPRGRRARRPLRPRRRRRGPGKVERFRGKLSAEVTALRRIEPGSFDPAEFLPVRLPFGRGAERLPRASDAGGLRPGAARRSSSGCSTPSRSRRSSAVRPAPAAATMPTSAGCSSTPLPSARSSARSASFIRSSTLTC